jgi:Protein phosphatase 2C
MTPHWRHVGASVAGTSHEKTDDRCQDAHAVALISASNDEVLVAAVSDGAGSAECSAEGSILACRSFVQAVGDHLRAGRGPVTFDRTAALCWVSELQNAIAATASEAKRLPRDYACTFLGAVVGLNQAVFVQVGDGAIVVSGRSERDDFAWVFWPQNGEYANTTFFLTEDRIAQTLQHVAVERAIDEVALFSDGVQTLALQLQVRAVHQPFFKSIFAPLRKGIATDPLTRGLRQFLSSDDVNARTDDDKTLVLASRIDGTTDRVADDPSAV